MRGETFDKLSNMAVSRVVPARARGNQRRVFKLVISLM